MNAFAFHFALIFYLRIFVLYTTWFIERGYIYFLNLWFELQNSSCAWNVSLFYSKYAIWWCDARIELIHVEYYLFATNMEWSIYARRDDQQIAYTKLLYAGGYCDKMQTIVYYIAKYILAKNVYTNINDLLLWWFVDIGNRKTSMRN